MARESLEPRSSTDGRERGDPHARFLAVARFGSLDGLRCLAVVPVVFHHATPRPLEGVLGKGPLGVDLFFAISGFLITTLLLRERRRTGGVDVRGFYRRRAVRIFPLYYAVLALTIVRAAFLPHDSPVRAHFFESLPAYATFTTTWFVDFGVAHPVLFAYSWSLAVEEQFYAVWPWIVRTRSWAPWVACLGLLAVSHVADHVGTGPAARHALSGLRTALLLGALLACVLHHPTGFRLAYGVLGRRFSALVAFGLLTYAVVSTHVSVLATHTLVVLLVGTAVVREDHTLARVLTRRPLRHVGEVSYGVYMLHLAAIAFAKLLVGPERESWGSGALVFALALPLSVAVATASHVGFERRFLRFGRPPSRGANVQEFLPGAESK